VTGETTARGYGWDHQQVRSRWVPIVAAGQGYCHAPACLMPSRWIPPGALWDLGHTDDRQAYTGPEHRKCNRSAGARKRNAAATRQPLWSRW
jgi:hypothetical protein